MDPVRLTGFVYPVKKNGVPVRGRWQLWVNLPSEPAFDRDGQPVLDAKGRQKQKLPEDHQGGRGPGQEGRRATAGDMDRRARVAPHHRPRPSAARRAPRPLARGDPRRDARRQLQLLPAHPPDPRRPGPRPGPRRQAHPRAALDLLRREDARQQEEEAAGRDHRRPPPRDAQDRLQLGARGGAAPREPGAARQEPAGAAPEDAPRVEHGGDREHGDQARAACRSTPPACSPASPACGSGRSPASSGPTSTSTRGFVTVCRTIEEDDDGTLLEYPPKNGKARTVPLPAAACDELRVWLAAQKEYRLAQGPAWNEAGRVVPKKDGSADGALDPEEPVVELGGAAEDRPAPADPRPQGLLRHLGLRDLRGQAGAGVARALRPGDHAAALRAPHHGRAGEGRGRARRGDAGRARAGRGEGRSRTPSRAPDNVVSLAGRRR